MGREINIDSILVLDKRIKKITAELARLKRSRNSLLNIARVPPEILGHIFRFNVVPEFGDGRFATVRRGSYNFLLVCHHWFEVARRTPELWSFWGNNLDDWKRQHLRSGISALDLVLDGLNHEDGSFDEALRDALGDRAARGLIRKVHLRGGDAKLLTAIISSLTPEDEGVRHSSIESIDLSGVDVSGFFARRRFPKLRDLYLSGRFKISTWDHLKLHTTVLTNLSLDFIDVISPSAIPTTSQILSLLASNPNIRSLMLRGLMISDDGENGFTSSVPLCHLEQLSLTGKFHHVHPILHRLELPERIDKAELGFHNCAPEEAVEAAGPYIRDRLQRDARFRDRLGVFVATTPKSISLHASVVGVGYHGPNRLPQHGPPDASFRVGFSRPISFRERKKLRADVLALLPLESIVNFKTELMVTEEVIVTMPNLETLHLVDIEVSDGFLLPKPDGPNAHKKLLPSLQRLYLEDVMMEDRGWGPLVTYLTHQTSGDQTVSLNVFGDGVHVCWDVVEQIEDLVEEFIYLPDPNQDCPFDG